MELDVLNELPQCTACQHASPCPPFSPLYINLKPSIIVVAERPSDEERQTQAAFFDRHNKYVGKLIEQVLGPIVYFTYLLKCYTDKTVLAKKDVKVCKSLWFNRELAIIKPKVVLVLGKGCAKLLGLKLGLYYQAKIDGINWVVMPSASVIFNGGKTKETEFINFLTLLKGSSNVSKN